VVTPHVASPDRPPPPAGSEPPPAAKAGEVLTAESEPAAADDPVSFVSDENGTTFGHGVVAKGGSAEVGKPGATPTGTGLSALPVGSGPAVAPPLSPVPVPTTNLSRKPMLPDPNACKGHFPNGADEDSGTVTLTVVVRPDGGVSSVAVVSEDPKGQGFGAAARTCLLGRTFDPGLDEAGKPTLAKATIKVRFSR
jgi:protein TonB